jgi:hypothetical protein
MIGKLYVLSLFYMMYVASIAWVSVVHTPDVVSSNSQPLQPDERPTTFISTLTVPTEVLYMFTRDARGGDLCRVIDGIPIAFFKSYLSLPFFSFLLCVTVQKNPTRDTWIQSQQFVAFVTLHILYYRT